jgi:glycosyltransferase involved in cell wall biosynthesis
VTGPVVVNGRFLTMQQTGVQRYARNLLERLPSHVPTGVLVAVPPDRLVEASPEQIDEVVYSHRWHGPRGHAWEQLALPRLVRRSGPDAVLLSPANWGPVRTRRQVAVFLDIAPQLHPELFRAGYRAMSSVLTPALVRRCGRVGALCGAVARDLVERFDVDPARIDIMEPGVGAPFDSWLERNPGSYGGTRPYCLMVGGHDRRKNARWVLRWWPEVHAELGMELVIATRGRATGRFADDLAGVRGVSVRMDPDDEELCELYAGAMCLLWPSLYEGYGLPLLEAMSVGTPFLATDVGAARDLAIEGSQVLPLEPAAWIGQLRLWLTEGTGPLREASVLRARTRSWDATAAAAAASLAALAASDP